MSRLTKRDYEKWEQCNGYYNQKNAERLTQITHKLGKLEDLEEELGCPLEVVFKVLKGEKILCENEEYYGSLRWNFYTREFVFDLNTDKEITNFYLKTNDYGKNWWLKGEKNE
jgi:hypothetical protein